MVEHVLRRIFLSIQHLYPLLGDETKRNILARNIGVNMLGTFTLACLGWRSRHVLEEVWDATVQVLWKRRMTAESTTQMNKIKAALSLTKAYETRLFKYHPETAHIAVFFISYQCKNLVDSIIWKDSPLLIVHHILCIFRRGFCIGELTLLCNLLLWYFWIVHGYSRCPGNVRQWTYFKMGGAWYLWVGWRLSLSANSVGAYLCIILPYDSRCVLGNHNVLLFSRHLAGLPRQPIVL